MTASVKKSDRRDSEHDEICAWLAQLLQRGERPDVLFPVVDPGLKEWSVVLERQVYSSSEMGGGLIAISRPENWPNNPEAWPWAFLDQTMLSPVTCDVEVAIEREIVDQTNGRYPRRIGFADLLVATEWSCKYHSELLFAKFSPGGYVAQFAPSQIPQSSMNQFMPVNPPAPLAPTAQYSPPAWEGRWCCWDDEWKRSGTLVIEVKSSLEKFSAGDVLRQLGSYMKGVGSSWGALVCNQKLSDAAKFLLTQEGIRFWELLA